LYVDRWHVRDLLLENDQEPVKSRTAIKSTSAAAVKVNVGVDIEVMVKVDDPSYALFSLFFSS